MTPTVAMAAAIAAFLAAFAGVALILWLLSAWGWLEDPIPTPGERNDRARLVDEGRAS